MNLVRGPKRFNVKVDDSNVHRMRNWHMQISKDGPNKINV